MIVTITQAELDACNALLSHYGPAHQILKAAEESAELSAALSRLAQGATCSALRAVAVEIADELIMISQLYIMHPDLERMVSDLVGDQLARALANMSTDTSEALP